MTGASVAPERASVKPVIRWALVVAGVALALLGLALMQVPSALLWAGQGGGTTPLGLVWPLDPVMTALVIAGVVGGVGALVWWHRTAAKPTEEMIRDIEVHGVFGFDDEERLRQLSQKSVDELEATRVAIAIVGEKLAELGHRGGVLQGLKRVLIGWGVPAADYDVEVAPKVETWLFSAPLMATLLGSLLAAAVWGMDLNVGAIALGANVTSWTFFLLAHTLEARAPPSRAQWRIALVSLLLTSAALTPFLSLPTAPALLATGVLTPFALVAVVAYHRAENKTVSQRLAAPPVTPATAGGEAAGSAERDDGQGARGGESTDQAGNLASVVVSLLSSAVRSLRTSLSSVLTVSSSWLVRAVEYVTWLRSLVTARNMSAMERTSSRSGMSEPTASSSRLTRPWTSATPSAMRRVAERTSSSNTPTRRDSSAAVGSGAGLAGFRAVMAGASVTPGQGRVKWAVVGALVVGSLLGLPTLGFTDQGGFAPLGLVRIDPATTVIGAVVLGLAGVGVVLWHRRAARRRLVVPSMARWLILAVLGLFVMLNIGPRQSAVVTSRQGPAITGHRPASFTEDEKRCERLIEILTQRMGKKYNQQILELINQYGPSDPRVEQRTLELVGTLVKEAEPLRIPELDRLLPPRSTDQGVYLTDDQVFAAFAEFLDRVRTPHFPQGVYLGWHVVEEIPELRGVKSLLLAEIASRELGVKELVFGTPVEFTEVRFGRTLIQPLERVAIRGPVGNSAFTLSALKTIYHDVELSQWKGADLWDRYHSLRPREIEDRVEEGLAAGDLDEFYLAMMDRLTLMAWEQELRTLRRSEFSARFAREHIATARAHEVVHIRFDDTGVRENVELLAALHQGLQVPEHQLHYILGVLFQWHTLSGHYQDAAERFFRDAEASIRKAPDQFPQLDLSQRGPHLLRQFDRLTSRQIKALFQSHHDEVGARLRKSGGTWMAPETRLWGVPIGAIWALGIAWWAETALSLWLGQVGGPWIASSTWVGDVVAMWMPMAYPFVTPIASGVIAGAIFWGGHLLRVFQERDRKGPWWDVRRWHWGVLGSREILGLTAATAVTGIALSGLGVTGVAALVAQPVALWGMPALVGAHGFLNLRAYRTERRPAQPMEGNVAAQAPPMTVAARLNASLVWLVPLILLSSLLASGALGFSHLSVESLFLKAPVVILVVMGMAFLKPVVGLFWSRVIKGEAPLAYIPISPESNVEVILQRLSEQLIGDPARSDERPAETVERVVAEWIAKAQQPHVTPAIVAVLQQFSVKDLSAEEAWRVVAQTLRAAAAHQKSWLAGVVGGWLAGLIPHKALRHQVEHVIDQVLEIIFLIPSIFTFWVLNSFLLGPLSRRVTLVSFGLWKDYRSATDTKELFIQALVKELSPPPAAPQSAGWLQRLLRWTVVPTREGGWFLTLLRMKLSPVTWLTDPYFALADDELVKQALGMRREDVASRVGLAVKALLVGVVEFLYARHRLSLIVALSGFLVSWLFEPSGLLGGLVGETFLMRDVFGVVALGTLGAALPVLLTVLISHLPYTVQLIEQFRQRRKAHPKESLAIALALSLFSLAVRVGFAFANMRYIVGYEIDKTLEFARFMRGDRGHGTASIGPLTFGQEFRDRFQALGPVTGALADTAEWMEETVYGAGGKDPIGQILLRETPLLGRLTTWMETQQLEVQLRAAEARRPIEDAILAQALQREAIQLDERQRTVALGLIRSRLVQLRDGQSHEADRTQRRTSAQEQRALRALQRAVERSKPLAGAEKVLLLGLIEQDRLSADPLREALREPIEPRIPPEPTHIPQPQPGQRAPILAAGAGGGDGDDDKEPPTATGPSALDQLLGVTPARASASTEPRAAGVRSVGTNVIYTLLLAGYWAAYRTALKKGWLRSRLGRQGFFWLGMMFTILVMGMWATLSYREERTTEPMPEGVQPPSGPSSAPLPTTQPARPTHPAPPTEPAQPAQPPQPTAPARPAPKGQPQPTPQRPRPPQPTPPPTEVPPLPPVSPGLRQQPIPPPTEGPTLPTPVTPPTRPPTQPPTQGPTPPASVTPTAPAIPTVDTRGRPQLTISEPPKAQPSVARLTPPTATPPTTAEPPVTPPPPQPAQPAQPTMTAQSTIPKFAQDPVSRHPTQPPVPETPFTPSVTEPPAKATPPSLTTAPAAVQDTAAKPPMTLGDVERPTPPLRTTPPDTTAKPPAPPREAGAPTIGAPPILHTFDEVLALNKQPDAEGLYRVEGRVPMFYLHAGSVDRLIDYLGRALALEFRDRNGNGRRDLDDQRITLNERRAQGGDIGSFQVSLRQLVAIHNAFVRAHQASQRPGRGAPVGFGRDELHLLAQLTHVGLIRTTRGGLYEVVPGRDAALVAIPRDRPDQEIARAFNRALFAHEPSYRRAVEQLFRHLSLQEQVAVRQAIQHVWGMKPAANPAFVLSTFSAYGRDGFVALDALLTAKALTPLSGLGLSPATATRVANELQTQAQRFSPFLGAPPSTTPPPPAPIGAVPQPPAAPPVKATMATQPLQVESVGPEGVTPAQVPPVPPTAPTVTMPDLSLRAVPHLPLPPAITPSRQEAGKPQETPFDPTLFRLPPTPFRPTVGSPDQTLREREPAAAVPGVNRFEALLNLKLDPAQDYQIYRLAGTEIYHMEFKDTVRQTLTLARLVFFAERTESKGRVVTDAELEDAFRRGAEAGAAHDYRLQTVAEFYTKAATQQVPLNAFEIQLREDLLRLGLLTKDGEVYRPRAGVAAALITAPQDVDVANRFAPGELRPAVLKHEIRHGAYFTVPAYREALTQQWQSFTKDHRTLITELLYFMGEYDRSDEDLLTTEYAAYFSDPEIPLGHLKELVRLRDTGQLDQLPEARRKTAQWLLERIAAGVLTPQDIRRHAEAITAIEQRTLPASVLSWIRGGATQRGAAGRTGTRDRADRCDRHDAVHRMGSTYEADHRRWPHSQRASQIGARRSAPPRLPRAAIPPGSGYFWRRWGHPSPRSRCGDQDGAGRRIWGAQRLGLPSRPGRDHLLRPQCRLPRERRAVGRPGESTGD